MHMGIYSTSLRFAYHRLTKEYTDRCPPGKKLDDCELRANSLDAKSLRVKTGEASFFGRAKVRVAHQKNAARIVMDVFWTPNPSRWPPRSRDMKQAGDQIEKYIKDKNDRLTLGDLDILDKRLFRIVYPDEFIPVDFLDRAIRRALALGDYDESARDSKRDGVSAAAAVPAALSLSSAPSSALSAEDFQRAQPALPKRG